LKVTARVQQAFEVADHCAEFERDSSINGDLALRLIPQPGKGWAPWKSSRPEHIVIQPCTGLHDHLINTSSTDTLFARY
jgi:hypothetical protein